MPPFRNQRHWWAGRLEAQELLAQAEQRKGAVLTKREVRQEYSKRFTSRMEQDDRGKLPRLWFDGWCRGFVDICIQAEHAAPDEPIEPPPIVATVLIRFRQAAIEVDQDNGDFWEGIVLGQTCFAEMYQNGQGYASITGKQIFGVIAEAMEDYV